MAAVGVTPDYIREMRRQGLPANDPDEAIESRVAFPANHAGKAARAVAVAHANGASTVAIGPGRLVARSPDGTRTVIGPGGLRVRNPDGSTTVINAPPGDDDDN
jgi:hypothetical protein